MREPGRFERADFHSDADTDTSTGPGAQPLEYHGTPNKDGKERRKYSSKAATGKECPLREPGLPKKTPYRQITRWKPEDVVERHTQRMAEQGKESMRQRAGLAEPPFGTMKVWFGGLDAFRAYCQPQGSCAQPPPIAVIEAVKTKER